MKKITIRRKFLAVFLAFAVLGANSVFMATDLNDDESGETNSEVTEEEEEDDHDKLLELQEQWESINDELEELKKQGEALRDQENAQEIIIENLRLEIAALEEKISINEQLIEETEKNIEIKIAEIDNLNIVIDNNYEDYKSRLRQSYMGKENSLVSLFLGVTSFQDFLMGTTLAKAVAESDDELLNSLASDLALLETAKAELDSYRAQLEQVVLDLEVTTASLGTKQAEAEALQEQIELNIEQNEAETLEKQEEMKKNQDEIAAIVAAGGGLEDYVGGEYYWPVQRWDKSDITSYYGDRYIYGVYDFHTGFDIGGYNSRGEAIYGADISAANTGKVVYIRSYSYGYGNHILIDHGGGNYTLYAHLSSFNVQSGDTVTRGDTIGYVGSTGWSTGAHLHFEIWVDGKHVNPLSYF